MFYALDLVSIVKLFWKRWENVQLSQFVNEIETKMLVDLKDKFLSAEDAFLYPKSWERP